MDMEHKENFVRHLEKHGVYPTAQRIRIAEIMLSRDQHMSADKVIEAIKESDTAVSKATVYNTLGLFAEKGLLREVIVDPTKVFYDSNTSEHHHFYNVDTGEISDIHADQVLVGELPVLPESTEVDGVEVIIRIREKSES